MSMYRVFIKYCVFPRNFSKFTNQYERLYTHIALGALKVSFFLNTLYILAICILARISSTTVDTSNADSSGGGGKRRDGGGGGAGTNFTAARFAAAAVGAAALAALNKRYTNIEISIKIFELISVISFRSSAIPYQHKDRHKDRLVEVVSYHRTAPPPPFFPPTSSYNDLFYKM